MSYQVNRWCFLWFAWLGCLCGVVTADEPLSRPNVLVIMVDDLGFSDVGCYGGEIETPNLDRLAVQGLRFSQFYNTAKCHSSRISLLTGCYALQAGNEQMTRAVTTAEMLGQAGYFTAMTGKWHLARQPTDFGFQRYFGHLSGACNYFRGDQTFRLNGQPWTVPDGGFYTTVANVDYAIDFLGEARQSQRPWYLYVAFNAPHAPLQALETDYRKYEGRYQIGWDQMRAQRVAKQQELGLMGADVQPSPRPDHIPAWHDLGAERQDWESRRMTTLAAMIDRVDQEVGRLVKDLERAGELENTLILFVSDNGACPYDRRSNNLKAEPTSGDVSWSDSTGWAWARNTPFRFYKQNQFEGGICTPAIVHWPAGLKLAPGAIVDSPAHLIDVLPTLAEICEVTIPQQWPGRQLSPLTGISLAPVLAGKAQESRPAIHFQFANDRGLREGDWKIVSFRKQPWELYNIRQDRSELNNLADAEPKRMAAMVQTWTEMAERVLRADKKVYSPVRQERTGYDHPDWTSFDDKLGPIGRRGK
ncbi:arylsulfatase [Planctomycetaceae bacterium SH139]